MLRLALGLLAFALIPSAAIAADGTPYLDPMGRFKVTVPAGWESGKPNNENFAFAMVSPKTEQGIGVCLVMVRELAETRNATQADIDTAFGSVMTREFWQQTFAAAGVKEVSIEDNGTTDRNGRKSYYVVATVPVQTPEGTVQSTGKQVIFVIPGSMQFINCSTKKDNFAALKDQFEAVFNTYEPLAGNIASVPASSPSLLTLFADAKFNGAARVLAQNTPNIRALGVPAGSLAVAGFGQWEVCEGVNYTGTCRVINVGEAGQPGQALSIGSVRRATSSNTRNATGILSTGAALTLKETSDRAAQAR